eukprot:CAMPEP_0118927914 /NCGR_PEP_ID=MMETSP1169-20130426/5291_1 /TAXON_ID=36882 /ORGANISM="Pyramimonas obovata, Strain CCMP722" /LENGTH=565 /DNA_ID=CAMNT_0006869785 /DNA_START=116 /DNA_END=1810 /DNA_ORIENTATION=-
MGDKKEEKSGSEEDDEYFFADIGDEEIEDWVSDDEYAGGDDEDLDLDDEEDKKKEVKKETVPVAEEKKEKEPEEKPKMADQQPGTTASSKGKDAEVPQVATTTSAKSAETSKAADEEPCAEEEEPDLEVDLRSPDSPAAVQAGAPHQDEAVEEGMSEEAETDDMEGGDTQQVEQQWGLRGLWGADTSNSSSQAKPEPTSGGGYWGWGKSLSQAVSKASVSLNAAVAGASKDWAELQQSVTAVVAPASGTEPGGQKEVVEEDQEDVGEDEEGKVDIEDEKKRAKLFAKFEEAVDDDELDHRLKTLDDKMEKLATSAWGAFGAAMKTASKIAKSAAEDLKQGMKDVNELHVVQVAGQMGSKLASKASTAASGLSTTALGMLTAQPTGWDQDPAALDKLSPEEVSFERCFKIYGGPEYLEELELMGNEATIKCNRARAAMAASVALAFEERIAKLHAILDLAADLEEELSGEADAPAVTSLLEMLAEAMRRAEGLQLAVAGSLRTAVRAALEAEEDDEEVTPAEVVEHGRSKLEILRAEGVKRLSEITTVAIVQLIQLGASMMDAGEE